MGKSTKHNTKHTDLGRSLIKGKNIQRRNAGRTAKNDSWVGDKHGTLSSLFFVRISFHIFCPNSQISLREKS